jgi:hypothetical protein
MSREEHRLRVCERVVRRFDVGGRNRGVQKVL